jgi:hypothetical protein
MRIIGITGQAGSGKDEIAGRFVKNHGYAQLSLADPMKRFGLNVFGFDVIQLWGPSSARNMFDPGFNECAIRSSQMTFEPGCSMSGIARHCDPGWADAAVRLTQYAPQFVGELLPVDEQEEALRMLYFWFASLGHHYNQLSPRIMLQSLGTEWGREICGDNVWIEQVVNAAQRVLNGEVYEREVGFLNAERDRPHSGVVVSDVRFNNELNRIHEVGGKVIKVTRKSSDKKAAKLGIAGHTSESEQKEFTADMFDAVLANEGTLPDLYKSVDVLAAAYKGLK